MKAIFSIFLLAKIISSVILSSVNFATYVSYSDYGIASNPLGLSMDFPTLLPNFNSQLLHLYILNSNINGNWGANFQQYVHVPVGYKYNCSLVASTAVNQTSNCTLDIKNSSLFKQMGDYIYNTTMYYSYYMGWDMQNSNFADNTYLRDVFIAFVKDLYKYSRQPFSIELADKGNLYSSLGIRENYTASQLIQDCTYVNKVFYGLNMAGPGTTTAADSSWYARNGEISYYCGLFTLRAVIFPNSSDLTINNLLSEKYTSQFLQNRMTVNGTSYMYDFSYYYGQINDIRLVQDPMGVDGLTNSFAAGIWAIQMALEFFYQSGYRMSYYNPMINGSFQNILNPGPTYTPTIMYSALLFANIAFQNYPYVGLSSVQAGLSKNIKVYLLDYYYNSGIVILNKDTNMSMNGQVAVTLRDVSGLYCIYLTAPNLSSTDGVTLGGLKFVGNSSAFVGNYTEYNFQVDVSGQYYIPINYSQVAYCYSKVEQEYTFFPTGKNSNDNFLFLSFLMFLIIYVVTV